MIPTLSINLVRRYFLKLAGWFAGSLIVFVEMEHLDPFLAMPGMPVRVSSSSNWDAPPPR